MAQGTRTNILQDMFRKQTWVRTAPLPCNYLNTTFRVIFGLHLCCGGGGGLEGEGGGLCALNNPFAGPDVCRANTTLNHNHEKMQETKPEHSTASASPQEAALFVFLEY